MNNRTLSRVTLAAAAVFVTFDASAKGWLEKTWNGLADAAHDVVTFGGYGRDRDRERAEAELRRIVEAKEAAERLRQAKIEALLKDVALLRDVTRAFESSARAVREVIELQDKILSAASTELAARAQAYTLVESVRDYLRKDGNDMLEILTALNSVPFLTEGDLTATFGPPGQRDISKMKALKARQQVVVNSIKTKVDVVQKSGATEAVYLEQVLGRIKTDGVKAVVGLAQDSRVRLQNLRTALEASRKTYRLQLGVQLDALVALQAGDRATLGAKWEAGLQPLQPLQAGPVAVGSPTVPAGPSLNAPSQLRLSAGIASTRSPPRVEMQYQAFAAPSPRSEPRVCLSFNRGCF